MAKVLLAEDDATMVSLLKIFLDMEGFQVATLLDQEGDFIENIRRENPDVLLLDVFLGEWNGVDIIRRMRQAPDLKRIKVVMTSGIDKGDECRAAGADDFLLKPFMPDELIQKIRG
jgi:DNA-binding response OmpR family regulator